MRLVPADVGLIDANDACVGDEGGVFLDTCQLAERWNGILADRWRG